MVLLARTALIAAFTAVVPVTLLGQQLESRPVASVRVESYTFQSPSMGVRFAVNVGIPKSYQPGGSRSYPALITTDGDHIFGLVNEMARTLMDQGDLEDLFIVSIGTGYEDGETSWVSRRIYEFSPPDWDMKDPFGVVLTGACKNLKSPPGRCTGGAPRFLAAITSELIPLITAKYPISRDQLGLFGVSAGGFFASWTLFQPSSPFKKYLISSPAMAYGNLDILKQEARWAAEHKDLPVAVYFGSGGLEIQDPMFEGMGHITSGMVRVAGMLGSRKYPGLKLTTEIHPGMSHGDVVGTVLARGFRTLYPK